MGTKLISLMYLLHYGHFDLKQMVCSRWPQTKKKASPIQHPKLKPQADDLKQTASSRWAMASRRQPQADDLKEISNGLKQPQTNKTKFNLGRKLLFD